MRILVVNDDGIKAPGIKRLVQMAAGLGGSMGGGSAAQCSAMSHRITVRGDLEVKPYDFPATGVTAYRWGGTPADCVKVALGCLMTEKPDIVFSGSMQAITLDGYLIFRYDRSGDGGSLLGCPGDRIFRCGGR